MSASSFYQYQSGVKIHRNHGVVFGEEPTDPIYWEEETEDLINDVAKSFPSQGCYVNCGAAVGYYALMFKKIAPAATVHALEPLEMHRRFLHENMQLNDLSPDAVRVHSEGISHSDGQLVFYEQNFGSMILNKRNDLLRNRFKMLRVHIRHWLQTMGIRNYEISCTRINVMSMKSLVKRVGGHIDLLQSDVQGSEVDFLEGGLSTLQSGAITRFLIASHGPSVHDQCVQLLSAAGYHIDYVRQGQKDDGAILASKNVQPIICPAAA